jgi:hypothetical protein
MVELFIYILILQGGNEALRTTVSIPQVECYPIEGQTLI